MVLDYGCGAGQTIHELAKRGIEAYGCDVFYEGGDYSPQVPKEWLGTRVLTIEDGRIPWPSEHFDLVVNNQVMEHVHDLDGVLREMHRVLKPGGSVLSMFPDRGVWREPHCGIPFLHRFPKGGSLRVYYAALFRSLGFGKFTDNKGLIEWSRDFCEWLDLWTFYRPYSAIVERFEAYFSPPQCLEAHWLAMRLASRSRYVQWCPDALTRFAVVKLCGRVFVCRKLS